MQKPKLRSSFRRFFDWSKEKRPNKEEDPKPKDRSKWLIRPNFEYQSQRLKFGFGRVPREKLFAELARYNARLRELLDGCDSSIATKESRELVKKSVISKLIWKIWKSAGSLHNLLDQAWCCQCRNLHRIQLLLHHRMNIEAIEYDICFLYGPQPQNGVIPWRWKATNAQRLDHDSSGQGTSLQVPETLESTPTPPTSAGIPLQRLKPAMRRANHRSVPHPPKVQFTSTTSSLSPITGVDPHESDIINDLCSSIALCHPTKERLGLLRGEEDSYMLQRGRQPCGDAIQYVTLESLLDGSAGIKLDRRRRYTIAFTIASSHFQLYPSPWLQSCWNKKDIQFLRDPDNSSSILIDQAYILRDFSTSNIAKPDER